MIMFIFLKVKIVLNSYIQYNWWRFYIYITGDKHGDFREILYFCYENKTTLNDIMIILGDAGINYYADERDYIKK